MTKPIQNDPAREYAEAQVKENQDILDMLAANRETHAFQIASIDRTMLMHTKLRDQAQAIADAAKLPPKAAPKPDRVKPGAIPEAILAALKNGSASIDALIGLTKFSRDQLTPALLRMVRENSITVDAERHYRVSPPTMATSGEAA